MTWNVVRRRPFKYCVPCLGLEKPLTLERLYPSRSTVGELAEEAEGLCCIRVSPGENPVEVYRCKSADGGVVSIDVLHYYVDVPPSSVETLVAVSKDSGDSVSGYLVDAVTGERVQDISFVDQGDWAYGTVVLPRRGLYYAIIRVGGGVFVEELFFRRRVSVALQALIWAVVFSGGRRVVILA